MKASVIFIFISALYFAQHGNAIRCYAGIEPTLGPAKNLTQVLGKVSLLWPITCRGENENKCVYVEFQELSVTVKLKMCGVKDMNYCEAGSYGSVKVNKCYECQKDLCNKGPNPK